MQIISKEQYEIHISHDMREMFELFANMRFYFEALLTSNIVDDDGKYVGEVTVVARLDEWIFDECEFYNASCYFQHDGKYAFQKNADKIKSTYFSYDSIEDAKQHAFQLLTSEQIDPTV